MNKKIAIIGGGNLGTAIAEGLISSGFSKPGHIIVTRRSISSLRALEDKGVLVSDNNVEAVGFADLVILAIKPYQTEAVVAGIRQALNPARHILASVVTGISMQQLKDMAACPGLQIARAMPNTAIAIQESMTCLSALGLAEEGGKYIEDLFNQLGKAVWIDEKLMDAATVLGACGTAFAMRYIRANIQGGIEIGFSASVASLIAAQTVKGAAELLLKKGTHPEQEIDKVTTPKGCTIAGLNEMEHQGFSSSLIKGIVSSYKKIEKD